MKERINKTNAARLLDRDRVAYELIPYEVDESDLSAVHVAAQLGEDIDRVFKTLVAATRSATSSPSRNCSPSQATSAAAARPSA